MRIYESVKRSVAEFYESCDATKLADLRRENETLDAQMIEIDYAVQQIKACEESGDAPGVMALLIIAKRHLARADREISALMEGITHEVGRQD